MRGLRRDYLNNLEDIKFQIVGFRYVPKDGVIRRLLPRLHLTQLHAGVPGCRGQHLPKELVRHEVGAGASGEIAASGQQLHGAGIDLLVAPLRAGARLPALGESRRVEYDEIIGRDLFLTERRQQIKDVGGQEVYSAGEAVPRGVPLCLFQGGRETSRP